MSTAIGLQNLQSTTPTVESRKAAPDRLTSSAQQFESMLLGQWLADAESSFGAAPGGDDDQDATGDQMKDFSVRQLANQLTADGGVGIARMVRQALVKADAQDHDAPASSPSALSAVQVQNTNAAARVYASEVSR